jgi:protein involved in polysaccharide export with SLBB domain
VVVRNGITLIELLSKAEWVENADLDKVQVVRRVEGNDKRSVLVYRLREFIRPVTNDAPDYTQNPILFDRDAVFVPFKTLQTNIVSVSGEVLKPQYNLTIHSSPPTSVREAISLAGGISPTANRKHVKVVHSNGESVLIDLDKAEAGDPEHNILLRSEDAVYVEKVDPQDFVYVNGGFVKPGKFIYTKNMTLTQAIMEAGGLAPFAKIKEGRIIRHPDEDPKNTQVIVFDWKKLLASKERDITLRPGDSIWLAPGSPNQNGFNILNSLSSLVLLFSAISGRR